MKNKAIERKSRHGLSNPVKSNQDVIDDIILTLTSIYSTSSDLWVLNNDPRLDSLISEMGLDCMHVIVEVQKLREEL